MELVKCLKCGGDVDEVEGGLKEWLCRSCNTLHAIINGKYAVVPERGKISGWPELQTYFDDLLSEFLKGEDGTSKP